MLRRGLRATCALVVTALVATLGGLVPQPASASAYALIVGSGSGENMLNQWVADVDSRGLTVIYAGGGSLQGREDFADRSIDFALTDQAYGGGTDVSERPYTYVPLVAGSVGFAYHLKVGGVRLTNLRLSGATLARIFTGQITSWADPAITADNNGRILPATPIVPVVRSDDTDTTTVLTSYLATRFPAIWGPCNGGSTTATTYFPLHCGAPDGSDVAEAGADGVLDRVADPSTDGTIGYVETSDAVRRDVPVAAVENAAGYFVPPWGYGASIGLTSAQDRRAYPLSHAVSAIVPTASADPRMTTAKRQTLVDFLSYAVCAGQQVARPIGHGALPRNFVVQALTGIAAVAAGDEAVDLTAADPGACNTADIDEIAPQPQACQKRGAGPCGPPTPTRAPSIVGPVRVGATVRAMTGSWDNADSLSLRWLVDGAPIAGAVGARYRVPAKLLGRSLSVEVTGESDAYPFRTVTSSKVRVARGHLPGSRLRIAGRPVVGGTLVVRGARIAGAKIRVQWYAAGRKIPGARSLHWTLQQAQLGKRLTVRVVASAAAYETLVRTSPRTTKIRRR